MRVLARLDKEKCVKKEKRAWFFFAAADVTRQEAAERARECTHTWSPAEIKSESVVSRRKIDV